MINWSSSSISFILCLILLTTSCLMTKVPSSLRWRILRNGGACSMLSMLCCYALYYLSFIFMSIVFRPSSSCWETMRSSGFFFPIKGSFIVVFVPRTRSSSNSKLSDDSTEILLSRLTDSLISITSLEFGDSLFISWLLLPRSSVYS